MDRPESGAIIRNSVATTMGGACRRLLTSALLVVSMTSAVLVVAPAQAAPATASGFTTGPAVVRDGAWHVRSALSGGAAATSVNYGRKDDTPLLCDTDGNGVRTPVVVREGTWYVRDGLDRNDGARSFRYGRPGDQPVCGDWNGDGAETPGVVRGSWWYLRDQPSGGPGQHSFFYGRPGDLPVVGDWNGDGRDTAGMVRDGTWHLKLSLAPGPADVSFRYGSSDDQPVVGDWTGNGTDTAGIVRGGTWHLRYTSGGGAADHSFRYGKATDGFLVWESEHGGLDCPTAGPVDKDPRPYVTLPQAGILDGPGPDDADGAALRQILANANRYLLGASYEVRYARRSSYEYLDLLSDSKTPEYAIRRPAMEAFSLAVAVRTGAYEPTTAGRSERFATDHATWLTRSIACQHRTVTESGWGNHWQSALWAYFTGYAGWLLWDELDDDDRLYVARMVEHEANRFLDHQVPFQYDRDGREVYVGDTKAEENSWNAKVLQLATAMMPDHPNWRRWQHKHVELLVSSFATPSDLDRSDVVNGRPVRDWIAGWNVADDGTLVNHGRINPDYMTSSHQAWTAAVTYPLAGMATPEAAFHNGELIYGAYTNVHFDPVVGYNAPGGPMFDQDEVYYPEGDSWGQVRRINFLTQDVMAETFALDGARQHGATHWKRLRTQQQLSLQSRFADGRTYTDDTEFRYPGREEYTAQMAAMAWLTVYVTDRTTLSLDRDDYGDPDRVGDEDPDAEPPTPEPDEDDEDVELSP